MLKKSVFTNEKQKLKMKKNANSKIDYEMEKKLDPKFKTELCKSWGEKKFCVYGNSCRFAHGNNELCDRLVKNNKYKQKNCKSFQENGVCMYGKKCNFKHDDRKFDTMDRSYYNYSLQNFQPRSERLDVFKNLSRDVGQVERESFIKQHEEKLSKTSLLECLYFYFSHNLNFDCKNEFTQNNEIKSKKNSIESHFYFKRPNFVNMQSLKMSLY